MDKNDFTKLMGNQLFDLSDKHKLMLEEMIYPFGENSYDIELKDRGFIMKIITSEVYSDADRKRLNELRKIYLKGVKM